MPIQTHIYIWHSSAQGKWPRFRGSNVYVIQLNRDWHNKATSFISSKSCHPLSCIHRPDCMPFLLLLNTAPHEWEVDGVAWCWYVNKLYTNIHPVDVNSRNATTLFPYFSMTINLFQLQIESKKGLLYFALIKINKKCTSFVHNTF